MMRRRHAEAGEDAGEVQPGGNRPYQQAGIDRRLEQGQPALDPFDVHAVADLEQAVLDVFHSKRSSAFCGIQKYSVAIDRSAPIASPDAAGAGAWSLATQSPDAGAGASVSHRSQTFDSWSIKGPARYAYECADVAGRGDDCGRGPSSRATSTYNWVA